MYHEVSGGGDGGKGWVDVRSFCLNETLPPPAHTSHPTVPIWQVSFGKPWSGNPTELAFPLQESGRRHCQSIHAPTVF